MTTETGSNVATGEFIPVGLRAVVLLRLAASGKPPSANDLRKSIERYFVDRSGLTAPAWKELFDAAIEQLRGEGKIETRPFRLTDSGRTEARHFFGFPTLPTSMAWQTLKNRYLVAAALERPISESELKKVGFAKHLYAAILTQHFALPIDSVPTEAAALDALAWKQLLTSHPEDPPYGKAFKRNAVLAHVFFEGIAAKNPAARLAAMVTGLAVPNIEKIRTSLINNWLDVHEGKVPERESQSIDGDERVTPRENEELELSVFADRIRRVCREATEGRFGESKVFIAQAYQDYQREYETIDRQSFDAKLLAAGRSQLLTLSRADLVAAMDPDRVQSSEVLHRDGHGSFHFVRTD